MATSSNYDAVPTSPSSSSNNSQANSPTDRTRLMSNGASERRPNPEVERWVFSSPVTNLLPGVRRFHSPRIYTRHPISAPNSPPQLVRSVSEGVGINTHWQRDNKRLMDLGPPKSSSVILSNPTGSPAETSLPGDRRYETPTSIRIDPNHHNLNHHHVRNSSMSDAGSTGVFRTASILSEIRPGAIISRSSTRRSFGREWTRSHWEKVRDLEQESERARRCSKLSSGFAPLMVFGGLVFICIGVSATTNNGKDREKLQKLSAAPMAMGVFMLALGIFLIASWFGCRGRAKGLEQQLLHGSRRNSIDENMVQNLISKLYQTSGANRRQQSSPTLPGVTIDGVDVLKPQSDKELRSEQQKHHEPSADNPSCCSRCGANNAATQVVLETAI